jgi:hypothetical protein
LLSCLIRHQLIAWHCPPVGDDEALEAEAALGDGCLQNISEQVLVLRALDAVDLVVGRHDAADTAVLNDHLEVTPVDLAQGLLVHDCIMSRHFAVVLGFGSAFSLVFWLPCLGVVMLPVGVAAATQLYWEIERAGWPASADRP